jgi:hypothetical protein
MRPSAVKAARNFWTEAAQAGHRLRFPCDIENAAALILPISVVRLSRLTAPLVREWLQRNGIEVSIPSEKRELMGCVVAYGGHALVFVCASDTPEEQRFTVAHEIAHVTLHYLLPRSKIRSAMGESILAVLDGHRRLTALERAQGILNGVRIGPHVHLMQWEPVESMRRRAESEADELALELVAPRQEVQRALRHLSASRLSSAELERRLAGQFGVPGWCFADSIQSATTVKPVSFVAEAVSNLRSRRGRDF